MFILCGLILEAGENLFRDFWSPFSISFVCFSARNYLKKTRTALRAVPEGSLYKAADPSPSRHQCPRPQTLTLARRRRRPLPPCRPAALGRLEIRATVFLVFVFLIGFIFLSV